MMLQKPTQVIHLLILLVCLITCVEGTAMSLEVLPTTIKLDFIGVLAVTVSAISVESMLEGFMSHRGRWRCAMTGPGYLQPGLAIAVDVFKHIFTLQVCDAVNFPFRLIEKVDTKSYLLPNQKPQPLESGYLATVLARHNSSISSNWSDQRTQAMICLLRRDGVILEPGRDGSVWSNYFLWLVSMTATAAPLAVAVWQEDWWMLAFGALLVLDAILRTAYAMKADMSYKIDFDHGNQNNSGSQEEGSNNMRTTVARYGNTMCLISGSTDVVKPACRSRIVGKVVPRFLTVIYAISSILQLFANLIAVPNGGAYSQLAYLGTICVCFFMQTFCHRLRTRVGPDQHRVICSVLGTKVEAVAYMAYLIRVGKLRYIPRSRAAKWR
ncbi:hypothetical protein INT43_003055 [Umbelopsis isabellina]|uniref:Uncharacterized protein n=1 Tax=Mortierella isabellina TaxID=91625 RepID=A0A8H7PQ01_MORIS|nr:hypothetical protein INT43_003055 [Umbelopsis isabellina]